MKAYRLIYKCRNCWVRFNVDIPFGKEALIYLNCPNCGRNEVHPDRTKDNEPITRYCKIENEQLVEL